jgi:hypothetical protein
MRRAVVLLAALCLILSGCANRLESAPDSGVTGMVVAGPQCPVETEDSPCPDAPTEAIVRVFEPGETDPFAEVPTDAGGRFRIELDPGDYVLEAAPKASGGIQFGKPQDVTVRAHEFTEVTLLLDTGIR